jgi:hypothetical protein
LVKQAAQLNQPLVGLGLAIAQGAQFGVLSGILHLSLVYTLPKGGRSFMEQAAHVGLGHARVDGVNAGRQIG